MTRPESTMFVYYNTYQCIGSAKTRATDKVCLSRCVRRFFLFVCCELKAQQTTKPGVQSPQRMYYDLMIHILLAYGLKT